MLKDQDRATSMSIATLSAWSGTMFVLYALTGVSWFHLGDFRFRTAMAYHGILIPAWMTLLFVYSRHIVHPDFIRRTLGPGAISASVLVGIGSVLIRDKGFSLGTGIQVTGMVLAEITALVIITESIWYHFKNPQEGINTSAWWSASIGLAGLSLATPLGHLAGAARDLGGKIPLFAKHVALLGQKPEAVIGGYIGSHSHQSVAAFIAVSLTLPLIPRSSARPGIVSLTEKAGLSIVIATTIVQVILYQYSAWFGWNPPDLFSSGPNGLPLDDLILVILGLGMLLLIPTLLIKGKRNLALENYPQSARGSIIIPLLSYMIAVVTLGLYIEFHEQYFGHGEGNALGVMNDMAYIRAHLLFGFMVIPVLLTILLNIGLLNTRRQRRFITGLATLAAIIGAIGTFTWTFILDSLMLKGCLLLAVVSLLTFALLVIKGSFSPLHRAPRLISEQIADS